MPCRCVKSLATHPFPIYEMGSRRISIAASELEDSAKTRATSVEADQRLNRFGPFARPDSKPNNKIVKLNAITIGTIIAPPKLFLRELLCHGSVVGFYDPSFETEV